MSPEKMQEQFDQMGMDPSEMVREFQRPSPPACLHVS